MFGERLGHAWDKQQIRKKNKYKKRSLCRTAEISGESLDYFTGHALNRWLPPWFQIVLPSPVLLRSPALLLGPETLGQMLTQREIQSRMLAWLLQYVLQTWFLKDHCTRFATTAKPSAPWSDNRGSIVSSVSGPTEVRIAFAGPCAQSVGIAWSFTSTTQRFCGGISGRTPTGIIHEPFLPRQQTN